MSNFWIFAYWFLALCGAFRFGGDTGALWFAIGVSVETTYRTICEWLDERREAKLREELARAMGKRCADPFARLYRIQSGDEKAAQESAEEFERISKK